MNPELFDILIIGFACLLAGWLLACLILAKSGPPKPDLPQVGEPESRPTTNVIVIPPMGNEQLEAMGDRLAARRRDPRLPDGDAQTWACDTSPNPTQPCVRCGVPAERGGKVSAYLGDGREVNGVQCRECFQLNLTDLTAWVAGFESHGAPD